MRSLLLLALLLVLGSATAACRNSGDDAERGDAVSSPLAEFLGHGQPADAEDTTVRAELISEQQIVQEAIAACMQRQGFDYVAYVPDESTFPVTDGELEWGSDEWIARYGFAITTTWYTQAEVGPELVGYHEGDDAAQVAQDPNAAVRATLSPAELETYYAALYGDPAVPAVPAVPADPAVPTVPTDPASSDASSGRVGAGEGPWRPGGCEGEASRSEPALRFYQDFRQELEEMYQRIERDPRIVEAEQEVAACVAEQGLAYSGIDRVYHHFEEALAEIDAAIVYPARELTEGEYDALSDAEQQAILDQPRVIPAEALAKLAELQAEEIALAGAVDTCGGGFDNQQDVYRRVAADHEQQFLDEHEAELAGYQPEPEPEAGSEWEPEAGSESEG